jgi:hypothetical protein
MAVRLARQGRNVAIVTIDNQANRGGVYAQKFGRCVVSMTRHSRSAPIIPQLVHTMRGPMTAQSGRRGGGRRS